MAAADDVDDLIGRFHQALDEFVKGHPEPCKELLFHREDVTLNNPFLALPYAAGTRSPLPWTVPRRISERAPWSPSQELAKYVTPEFAYAVWLERRKAKMGGRGEATPSTLRVTMIFRPEDGTWRVLHHHADPTATPRPAETVIQE